MPPGEVYGSGGTASGGRPRRTQRAGEGSTTHFRSMAPGGAHLEHAGHARDAGGVETQRLIERRRLLPRVERRAYGAGRGAGWEAEAGGDRGARIMQGRVRLQIWGRPWGGAHPEHVAHVHDAGGVEAQRLVERRALPRVEKGHAVRGEVYGSGDSRWRATAVQAACRGGLDCRFGAGRGEERTRNMCSMVVTLEVSKLSAWLNADAPCRVEKRA